MSSYCIPRAFIREGVKGPHLIVVPGSTLENCYESSPSSALHCLSCPTTVSLIRGFLLGNLIH
jgi:hypothetical protein